LTKKHDTLQISKHKCVLSLFFNRLLDSGRVLASSEGLGFNPQSRTASYQRCYKNGCKSSGATLLSMVASKMVAIKYSLWLLNAIY